VLALSDDLKAFTPFDWLGRRFSPALGMLMAVAARPGWRCGGHCTRKRLAEERGFGVERGCFYNREVHSIDHHLVASVSIAGTCLDVLGSLYLAYDLLGGERGPLRLVTRAVTYSIVFAIGYALGLGLFFGVAAGLATAFFSAIRGFGFAAGLLASRESRPPRRLVIHSRPHPPQVSKHLPRGHQHGKGHCEPQPHQVVNSSEQ
jgi:hypothetical protein